MLEQSGWVVQDKNTVNLYAATGVAVREFGLKAGHGTADYLLSVNRVAIGVVEARPEGFKLSGVETQSAKYSTGLAEWVFLGNAPPGREAAFRDLYRQVHGGVHQARSP